MGKNWFDWTAGLITIIGAVNWGVYGVSRFAKYPFDLVTSWAPGWLSNSIFTVVGIASLYEVYYLIASRK